MDDKYYEYLVIILFSIFLGMIMAVIFLPKNKYHGPNAREESMKIYLNKKTKNCFKFGIQPLQCPEPKTIVGKLVDDINKILKS